jgi:hypothetical protein
VLLFGLIYLKINRGDYSIASDHQNDFKLAQARPIAPNNIAFLAIAVGAGVQFSLSMIFFLTLLTVGQVPSFSFAVQRRHGIVFFRLSSFALSLLSWLRFHIVEIGTPHLAFERFNAELLRFLCGAGYCCLRSVLVA